MAWMLLPARPSGPDLIAVCEAVAVEQHGAAALGRSSGSSVEFSVLEARPGIGLWVMLGPLGRFMWRTLGGRDSLVRATITSDAGGWMIVAEGRNVAAQFEFLQGVADYAVTKRWIKEPVAAELKQALNAV